MIKIIKRLANAAQKLQKTVFTISLAASTTAMSMTNSLAAPSVPNGVQTTETSQVVNIVVWIAVIAIAAVGGFPSVVKIVEGQSNEDVRGRNSGIAGLCVTAAAAGSVYAIKKIFFG